MGNELERRNTASTGPNRTTGTAVAPGPGKRTLVEAASAGTVMQRAAAPAGAVPSPVESRPSAASAGQPLPPDTRAAMEGSFGADFSAVRVHEGSEAPGLGAVAYTQGSDLHFAPGQYAPHTQQGRELLGHELAHVVQQSEGRVSARGPQAKGVAINDDAGLEREADERGARAARGEDASSGGASTVRPGSSGIVQRRIQPEDVASEMIGKEFTLSEDDGGLTAGTVVIPTAWDNGADTVPVQLVPPATGTATVHKTKLRPRPPHTAGMSAYSAGVGAQAAATERADNDVAAWRAREGQYTRNHALWEHELARLEQVAATRHRVLNRKLIQETQFNRFDGIIQSEVNAANAVAGYTGPAALDPNLVKSMIFQESQMGTSGEHLEVPPSHPVKTRFNIGQAVDSSGMQLLMVMEREQPTLIANFHLATLRRDLETAMQRKAALERSQHRNAAEDAELQVLNRQSHQNWENFIWAYRAAGQSVGFAEAVAQLFQSPGPGQPPRNEDYAFWIHVAVMWLFEKRRHVATWEEAIRAYNGSGQRAAHYRDAVVARRDSAAAAASQHTDFVPTGI